MATIYRFPLCIWKSSDKTVTVRIVDDGYDDVVVTAPNRKEAVGQIKELLNHLNKTDSWKLFGPDFFEPEIRVLKFSVLPTYRKGNRNFPCREQVRFRMPCIVGKREHGSRVGYLPTLGIFFDYHEDDSFEKLAIHIAQTDLAGKTPQELSRFLSPLEIDLDHFSITLKENNSGRQQLRELRPLSQVAEHLGDRRFQANSKTWEREIEGANLQRILTAESSSLCIVGPSGCGKSSILIEAVRKIERQDSKPGELRKRKFWLSSGSRLIAGMRYLGQWEERLEEVIQQLGQLDGVLCLESLSELMQLGGKTPESSLAGFLVPFLEHDELRIVVEATPEEFDACERQLPGFIDRLQIVKLEAFSEEQARNILVRSAENHTRNSHVIFPHPAALRTYELFQRFQPYVAFPGKVVQFMNSAVDDTLDAGLNELDVPQIEEIFSRQTGLPESLTSQETPLDHEEMIAFLKSKVIQQDGAVEAVSRTVAKFCAGLNDPGRPIGVFLFCGPTGVGKTQMVRALGEFLFPHRSEKDRIVRLDMSEYSGWDAAERLLGSPHGAPSDLVKRIRANPFSILLLDEIEKANEEIFDIFLSVFDEGRLTDPLGRITSFQSCLIIMTSNLGAGGSGALLGFAGEDEQESSAGQVDRSAITQFFRPEFFNRLDQVVYFDPLRREAIEQIARKEVSEISSREGLAERNIELVIEEEFVAKIAATGFDPVYGARPLQRAVEEILTLPLARWLSENAIPDGSKVTAQWNPENGRVAFLVIK